MEWKHDGVMKLIQAKAELREVREKMTEMGLNDDDDVDFGDNKHNKSEEANQLSVREAELLQLIANNGTDSPFQWTGQKVRIYFPDEGFAALARRDWQSQVTPCVEYSSCGGVQVANDSNDAIIIFSCPRASQAEFA